MSYFFGVNSFFGMLYEMEMKFPKLIELIWQVLLWVITPVVLAVLTVMSWINHGQLEYDDYVYPSSIQGFGWAMELMPLALTLLIPIYSIYSMRRRKGVRGKTLVKLLLTPTESWYIGARSFLEKKHGNKDVKEEAEEEVGNQGNENNSFDEKE